MREDSDMIQTLAEGRPGDFAVCPPVVAEIEYGIRRLPEGSSKRVLLEYQRDRYLGQFRWLPWNRRASVLYGEIKSFLESHGQLIDDFDMAISAIARSHNAKVLTANLVHFNRVPDLTCLSWV